MKQKETPTEKQVYKIGSVISENTYQINSYCVDLQSFADLMNALLQTLVSKGFLTMDEVTTELIKCLTLFDSTELNEIVSKKYKDEAANIQFEAARNQFLKGLESTKEDIENILLQVSEQYKKDTLRKGFRLDPATRFYFLTFSNGCFSFDKGKVIAEHTRYITTQEQADLMNRAYKLYEDMKKFEQDIESLNIRTFAGISERGDVDSLIKVVESKVYFTPENGTYLE